MKQARLEQNHESMTVIEIESIPSESVTKTNGSNTAIDYHPLLWLPITICLAIASTAFFLLIKPKKSIDETLKTSNATDRISCRQCQFFTRNPHLYCTVRPFDAMTEKAVDCSDFQRNEGREEQ